VLAVSLICVSLHAVPAWEPISEEKENRKEALQTFKHYHLGRDIVLLTFYKNQLRL
jgi:hypothetical protein